jgi:hypothetical protein
MRIFWCFIQNPIVIKFKFFLKSSPKKQIQNIIIKWKNVIKKLIKTLVNSQTFPETFLVIEFLDNLEDFLVGVIETGGAILFKSCYLI